MSKRPRGNLAPASKAKMAIGPLKGEQMISPRKRSQTLSVREIFQTAWTARAVGWILS